MGFPRQEYWSGLNPHLLHWQADCLSTSVTSKCLPIVARLASGLCGETSPGDFSSKIFVGELLPVFNQPPGDFCSQNLNPALLKMHGNLSPGTELCFMYFSFAFKISFHFILRKSLRRHLCQTSALGLNWDEYLPFIGILLSFPLEFSVLITSCSELCLLWSSWEELSPGSDVISCAAFVVLGVASSSPLLSSEVHPADYLSSKPSLTSSGHSLWKEPRHKYMENQGSQCQE